MSSRPDAAPSAASLPNDHAAPSAASLPNDHAAPPAAYLPNDHAVPPAASLPNNHAAPPTAAILSEPLAGLQAQAQGLAAAAALSPRLIPLHPRAPWRFVTARLWPAPLRAVALTNPDEDILLSAGGTAGVIARALRRPGRQLVQIQHPRQNPAHFDIVVVNRHDGLTGPNVVVTRTALHPITPARLAEAAALWRPRLAHLPRPLVAVLIGGSNGRFRLDAPVATALGAQLATMMRTDRVGLALTPSRRTAPEARIALAAAIEPLGAWVWDMSGDNPYIGLLALADAIVATEDSVSMVSEAVATAAPVLLAALPGNSRRIRLFNRYLIEDGRVRPFAGRLDLWPVQPIDDTPAAGQDVRHRLGY